MHINVHIPLFRPLYASWLAIVALLICATPSYAQSQIEGRVKSESGTTLEYVSVVTTEGGQTVGTRTDNRGHFSLRLADTGTYVIRFSLMGYLDTLAIVHVDHRATIHLNVSMRESASQLQEVDVVGQRNTAGGYTHIDIGTVENIVGPSEGVETIIKTLPDVASNNELSSTYSVRGGSFDENLVYINGVEIMRPQLVRCGQQEGMSIVNADMVDHLTFSPGGFEVLYGDKMSSVLDITYRQPTELHAKISGSLLGGSAYIGSSLGKLSFALGARYHSNRYILGSLDTKGSYSTVYSDVQTLISYKINDTIDLSFFGIWSHNKYGLIPESQTTTFGNFMQSMQLDIYFDGQETDSYSTLLGSFTLNYHPSDNFSLRWLTTVQSNNEKELYDIQDQYWLYELSLGSVVGEVNKFDRGVGTFLEHARNRLKTAIYSTEVRGTHYARLGSWKWGAKLQYESTYDRLNEWKWVDSAGYAMPTFYDTFGDSSNLPHNPILQFYSKADNYLHTIRSSTFLQRDFNWTTNRLTQLYLSAGLRFQYYFMYSPSLVNHSSVHRAFASPRINFSAKPNTKASLLFRTALGVYHQPPFYREMRLPSGQLNLNLHPQRSYQLVQSLDWDFRILSKPFRLTADVYAKFVDHLIPYTIDNLRLRYAAHNDAQGYAVGMSLRINGEFVEGLESWASISVMQARENILTDHYGWQPRPSDQRFSFKCYIQDYIPKMQWWRMSLNLLVSTGLPVTYPSQVNRSSTFRLPTYFRVDWGNSVHLSRFPKLARSRFFSVVDDLVLSLEVFNLFNYHNVVSFLWVADYENTYYPVPNYLTARQLNFKITLTF